MSQQKSSQQASSAAPSPNQSRWRWRVILGLAIGLCLFAALGIAAQQRARQAPRKAEPNARPAIVMTPSSLTPSTPAKEYIYAGGKLLATEEPRFSDVPISYPFYSEIEKIADWGITTGCGGGNYCPESNVTREQMAAFIIRALHKDEPGYSPPPPQTQRFADVPPSNPFYAHIEEMAVRQITLGCGGGNYCPINEVTREQMAAFIIRALHAPGYVPPTPPSQRFFDVPPSNPFYAHIEEMAVRGITLGCGGGNYCPTAFVTRGQMAAFLARAFGL